MVEMVAGRTEVKGVALIKSAKIGDKATTVALDMVLTPEQHENLAFLIHHEATVTVVIGWEDQQQNLFEEGGIADET